MEFQKSKKYPLLESISYVDGGVASKQVLKKEKGNVTLFAFDEGEGLTEHTSPFDAIVQVIEGEARISIAQEKFDLVKDDIILLPANIPHAVHATGKFKMLLIMVKS